MEYVRLGRTDLRVSRVAFGCEPLGGVDWGPTDEAAGIAAVRAAIDAGVTLFDTADIYGLGESERVLGRALGDDRDTVHIATKFGVRWQTAADGGRATAYRDTSAAWVETAITESMRRLGVDHIALYQLHWPDESTPIEASVAAMARLRDRGLIGAIGLSNVTADQVRAANAVTPIDSVQVAYNLGERAVEADLLPELRRLGINLLAYGPLAQGLLTGKFGPEVRFDTDDRRHRLPAFQGAELQRYLALAARLGEVGAAHGATAAQTALRWILDSAPGSIAIAGARQPEQATANAGAAGWQLSDAERAFLNAPVGAEPR